MSVTHRHELTRETALELTDAYAALHRARPNVAGEVDGTYNRLLRLLDRAVIYGVASLTDVQHRQLHTLQDAIASRLQEVAA